MGMKKGKIAYFLFFSFAAVFLLIVWKGLLEAQPGDENVYYYMAKLVSDGKIPYRDFFLAHPPLHVYILSILYMISGFNVSVLKLVPLISTLVTSFFIFKTAKECLGDHEAIASSLLFLSSYTIMFNSVFSFGIATATMFLAIAAYFLFARKDYLVAGIFFGLASITRLLTLIPIMILLVIAYFSHKKSALKLLSGFLIIFLFVNAAFVFLHGNDYIGPVYKFHLLKSLGSNENLREYLDIIKLNWAIFLSAAFCILLKDKKKINVFAAVSLGYLLFLLTLKRLFGFYFIVVFPFLALAAGYAVVNLLKTSNIKKAWKFAVVFVMSAVFLWDLTANVYFLQQVGFEGFARGNDIIDYVNSIAKKDSVLFGDNAAVPLIALMSGKKIAMDFVDTNNQVFISGLKDINEALSGLDGKDVIFVIRSNQGIPYFSEVRDFLNQKCDLSSSFHDEIEGTYLVYKCS